MTPVHHRDLLRCVKRLELLIPAFLGLLCAPAISFGQNRASDADSALFSKRSVKSAYYSVSPDSGRASVFDDGINQVDQRVPENLPPPISPDHDEKLVPDEPEWPSWSATPRPSHPIFPRLTEYWLVRPAHGFAQTSTDHDYSRTVVDERDLDYHYATNPPPIDLLRPDGMSPAGVYNATTLNAGGQLLISYRFSQALYSGNLVGSTPISNGNVLNTFSLVPTHMAAQRHDFIFQYAPTDDLTLQAILPIVQTSMSFADSTGNNTPINATDLTDIPITAMYVLKRWNCQQVHLNLGVQVPSGVFVPITQLNAGYPNATSPILTYPMRTSDGTYDFLPGLTYRGQTDDWTWGVQSLATVRFGINALDYRLGNQLDSTAWLARRLTNSLSTSLRIDHQWWGNIHAADPALNQALVETNVPNLQGGQRVNFLFGANSYLPVMGPLLPSGPFASRFDHYLNIEAGVPVYQNLDGPQLRQRFVLFVNWNLIF